MSVPFDPTKEPLLQPRENKYTMYPLEYPDIYQLFQQANKSFWTADEIYYSRDLEDYNNKLNIHERNFIENILGFFAGSDGMVNENLILNFYKEFEVAEIRSLYGSQINIENIHSEVYSLFIQELIQDREKKNTLFNAINEIKTVKLKADWTIKWLSDVDNIPLNERLIAFIIIEGIFFCGSFAAIFWLKKRGLMKELTKANEFISRDETLHCRTGVVLYSKLLQKLPETYIHSIFKEAVDIEKQFMTESLPVSLIGMNCNQMTQYIEFVADYWLTQLNYNKIYNTTNPFNFMEFISLENKTNFFEQDPTNYQKARVTEFALDHNSDF